jgi:hypothetical protein
VAVNEALMGGAIERLLASGVDATLDSDDIVRAGGGLVRVDHDPIPVKAYVYGTPQAVRVEAATTGQTETVAGLFALLGPEAAPVAGTAKRVVLDAPPHGRFRSVDVKPLAPHGTVLGYIATLVRHR